jgi:RHS repeat-associated protein
VNGQLDHILHEEGRVVFEDGMPRYEFFIKDHLGNVRQVIRIPERNTIMATMEMPAAKKEEQQFEQMANSRQMDARHNATPGGNRVAWLNAGRGRILGPATTRGVKKGGKVELKVHAKYEDPVKDQPIAGRVEVWGSKTRLMDNLQEFGKVSAQQLSVNPFWLLSMVDLLGKALQTKEAPEAYMMYALYDQDSIRYATGKQVLTKNAANRHEILKEEVYIAKDGYIQAFLVNETEEHVWFDDFTVTTELPVIVQETHYDPWGLQLKGLGYQEEKIKTNRYLYNGKEHIPDLDLNLYDYGARMYDPVIGRWSVVDPLAEDMADYSPYNYAFDNPIKFIDPDGMKPMDTFKQDKDGRYTKVNSDGGSKFHTFISNNKSITYVDLVKNRSITIDNKTSETNKENTGSGSILKWTGRLNSIVETASDSKASKIAGPLITTTSIANRLISTDFSNQDEVSSLVENTVQDLVEITPVVGPSLGLIMDNSKKEDGIMNTQTLTKSYKQSYNQNKKIYRRILQLNQPKKEKVSN